ncbi:phosphate-starvation-inducible PsiE family protein [Elioraea thermophila]|uniref:phosphate-starvation-inducible PsiE family protein n=1 Tax=Elioraea thermophila TaxID=2185104 RepID=UPI000DF21554|nr:phosphate-starvation-inducible PsiE family protein [Elioraea thermophila]
MPDTVPTKNEGRAAKSFRDTWRALSLYEKFEQAVVLVLTGVIAVIIVSALWNLILRVALSLVLADVFDPTDPVVFQTIFGAIFTVIIALEFKRSILVVAERRFGVVQVRAVILIAMLAIVRKLIILDLSKTEPGIVLALATAILALGAVYWLVREQDRRDREAGLVE